MNIYKVLLNLISVSILNAAEIEHDTAGEQSLSAAPNLIRSRSQEVRDIELGLSHTEPEEHVEVRSTIRDQIETGSSESNISKYYDRDAYITARVQQLILDEARYAVRSRIYNVAGAGFMWLAGLCAGTTTVVAILGGSEIISPVAASVTTGCLGAFSGVCMWASTQCKKSGDQYYQASTSIQLSLGVPRPFITPKVDIRIDPFRQGPQAPEPARTHAAAHSSGIRH